MASLSHASFATPNTQQLSPSHKLLPSHISMDPASSSLSTLTQPYSSAELTSWLQQPNTKLPYNQLHTMSSFNHQYGISSDPLYEGYSRAGDSVEQGFVGGDDPLLTSSWEALDKLVSASMTGSGSGDGNEISEFAYSSAQGSTLQSASPSSMTAVEQKPFNMLSCSNNQKGGVCNMWANSQASANNGNINAHTTNSVGLNLASFITADPGFVERAAKFSSYSQQAHSTSFNQYANNMTSINNALSLENSYLDCARKISSMSATKALSTNGPVLHRGDNVAMEYDANSDVKASTTSTPKTLETKQSSSPQRSMAGSKKKREGSSKDGEMDEAGATVGRKRAKGEEDISNGKTNNKVGRGSGVDQNTKVQQCAGISINSTESEQKSGGGVKEIISKPNGSNTTTNTNGSSASQAPKPDFIHVRARRGQATDSHSLAERVRREKISERMKYLQDLVPGCTKVTGKAMMLDEIINYVQSLQRQVEFLSMKLAAVHPSKLEFNFESLFGNEVVQQSIVQNNPIVSFNAQETHALLKSYPLLHENVQQLQPHHQAFSESNPSSSMLSYGSDAALRSRTLSMLAAATSDTFGDQSISSQIPDSWDEDLQNLVQLGFPQTPLNVNSSLHGALLLDQMKTEL